MEYFYAWCFFLILFAYFRCRHVLKTQFCGPAMREHYKKKKKSKWKNKFSDDGFQFSDDDDYCRSDDDGFSGVDFVNSYDTCFSDLDHSTDYDYHH